MIKLKHRGFLLFIFLIYSLGSVILIKNYEFQINPDGTSYLSIAQKYASGNFSQAINKYWPPLYSWIISPFTYLVKNPLLSEKIFSSMVGLAALSGLWILSYKFKMEETTRRVALTISIPVIWFSAFSVISPDLLLTCILIFYINIILSSKFLVKSKFGIYAGILGGLAHLTKAFGFYFFLLSYFIYNLILLIKSPKSSRNQIIKNFILGMAVFFAICGVWILVLTLRYQHFNFYVSNYGNFTHAFVGPNKPNLFSFSDSGLLPPQNDQLSIWEDLSNMKIVSWNPLGSWANFNYMLYKVKINSILFVQSLNSFSYLSVPLIFTLFLISLKKVREKKYSDMTIFTLVTILMFLPLLFVWIDGRYLGLIYLLLILAGGFIINKFRYYKNIILFMFVISVLINPIIYLVKNKDTGKDYFNLANKIIALNKIHSGSRVASNNDYFESLYLTFYLKGKYYGYPNKNTTDNQQLGELSSNQIEYYFAWNSSFTPSNLRENFNEISNENIPELKIYKLK